MLTHANKFRLIVGVSFAIALIALLPMPWNYYGMLRWTFFIFSLYGAWLTWKVKPVLAALLGAAALIHNPFYELELNYKLLWLPLNLAAVFLFALTAITLGNRPDKEDGSITNYLLKLGKRFEEAGFGPVATEVLEITIGAVLVIFDAVSWVAKWIASIIATLTPSSLLLTAFIFVAAIFMVGGDSYASVFRAIFTDEGAIAIVGLVLYNAVSAFALLGATRFILRSGKIKLLGSSLITSVLWIVGLSIYLALSGLHEEVGDGILKHSKTIRAPQLDRRKRTYGPEYNLSNKYTSEQKWLEAAAQLERNENWHGLYDLSLEWRARELNNPYAWNTAGLAYYGLGDNIRAITMFERALSLAPDSVMIRRNLGIARETYEQQGTKNFILGKGSLAAD